MAGIVVGVDGSGHSRIALEWALNEAALRRVPLTVLAVSPVATSITGLSGQFYPADEENRAQLHKAAHELLDKVMADWDGKNDLQVSVQAVSGLPADELVKASHGADLVIVGARGVGGFAKLVLGSVSDQVAHHAHCPVVIVRGEQGR